MVIRAVNNKSFTGLKASEVSHICEREWQGEHGLYRKI